MKICTDISQSKKLKELGIDVDTADMWYLPKGDSYELVTTPSPTRGILPAWSLAALLEIIPYAIHKSDNEFYRLGIDKGYNDYAVWYNNNGLTIKNLDVTSDNFVDACVEMIMKLHEQNLL